MRTCALVILTLTLTAGFTPANNVIWNPSGEYPDEAFWDVASNWNTGQVPGEDQKAMVRASVVCILDSAENIDQMSVGDGGDDGASLRIVDGGSLVANSATSWSAVGYNRDSTVIVEGGAVLETDHRMLLGRESESHLIVDGGTVIIGGNLQVGNNGGFGRLTVESGSLVDIAGDIQLNGGMLINVRGGTIIINGDKTGQISNWQGSQIVAYGGAGILVYDFDQTYPGRTTITAVALSDPPTPNPATFQSAPAATGPDSITMTATIGSSDNEPIEYLFTETSGNHGGSSSGWQLENTYTDTGLSAETTYSYTVTARDAVGQETDASSPASATTWSGTMTDVFWDKTGPAGDWGRSSNWTGSAPGRPDGHFRCRFTRSNRAESRVTGEHIFYQLQQNVNGSVIRVQDGGSLTMTAEWSGIGVNQGTNRMIVESGGVVNFHGHAWIGFSSSAIGILDINGGTVNVSEQLGLGWNGGTGYANIRDGGILNLDRLDHERGIHGISRIDIESGFVVIDGEHSSAVKDYIDNGKITAYGGQGIVLFDYNATHPGRTTIAAMEQTVLRGDINNDGRVDIADLKLFVDNWLIADCDSPAYLDDWCLINFRDFGVLASNWLEGISPPDWHVADAAYLTDDIIVAPYAAVDFGIVADGQTDVTDRIQQALIWISNMGGGELFLPAGNYRVEGTLTVPSRVTLRGDWQQPQPGSPVVGTILKAYAGRGDEDAAAFIKLMDSSGVKGMTIWYPEQVPDDIQPYPPTIQADSSTVEDVTFVNSYFALTTYGRRMKFRPFVRNVYGTPLRAGIEFDTLADIGRIETVHFSPDFWAGSGLVNSPVAGEHEAWIYNNGTGIIFRRIDWSYSSYVTIEGYSIGVALRPSLYEVDYGQPNGQSYMFNLLNCKTGIFIEVSARAGYQFTRFDIKGAQTGVYLSPATEQTNMFHTSSIQASGNAIISDGTARVLMMSCDIQGPVVMNGGYLSAINCDFSSAGNHIEIGSGVRGATIQGNTFNGTPRIVNNTSYPVAIDHSPVSVDPLPEYDFRKPTMAYKPAKTDLFVVTYAPYNAAADGVTDDTAAFQGALDDAGANGGGIVFVPGGDYRLNGNLVVPSGVELRGIFDIPHNSREKGSLLNIYDGRNDANGTPFIQLEPGSGVRGLNFHYPEQIYDEDDDDPETGTFGFVPYPYLIRGLGSDVYVINIAATIPYQLLDLATYRCDRHYVDYIFSTAMKTGIHVGNGSTDGQLHNVQIHTSSYTHQGNYYDSIVRHTNDNYRKLVWRDATPYLLGHVNNQVLHQNFVFGGAKGLHLVEENGFGPSGHALGFGADQCTNAMQIDYIGSDGFDMINSQLVTVDGEIGRYLETGPSLNDTFRMFSCASWGSHQYSVAINGGDVRLQLFHVVNNAREGAYKVNNSASLQNVGGNLRNYLSNSFLTVGSNATAEFIGNIINTPAGQMPTNTANVTSRGNLRVQ